MRPWVKLLNDHAAARQDFLDWCVAEYQEHLEALAYVPAGEPDDVVRHQTRARLFKEIARILTVEEDEQRALINAKGAYNSWPKKKP